MDIRERAKTLKSEVDRFGNATVGLAVGATVLVLMFGVIASIVQEVNVTGSQSFASTFKRVRPGMNRSELLLLLGYPDFQATEFYLTQREGFEAEYRAAEASHSAYFLVWHRESDTVYSVGLNDEHVVVFKASGGTQKPSSFE